jgi:hypothetical protein
MDEFDDLADAIIEDTYHIICPRCRAVTSAVAGFDDEIVCWSCEAITNPEQIDWAEQDELWMALIEDLSSC